MDNWSTDKIVGTGLVAALLVASFGDVVISISTGAATYGTLAKDITLGLVGYLGRGVAEHAKERMG